MIPPKPPSFKQKKKVEKFLGKGEEPVIVTSIGPRYFWINFFILLPFALIFIGLPRWGKIVRMRQSYTYVLTNRRFMIIRGIFSRKIVTAPLKAVTHVTVEQSVLQRFLFNTGHLVIITAGFDQREIVIENIGNPLRFKVLMEDLTHRLDDSTDSQKSPMRSLSA